MADVVHRTTKQHLRSVNTPEYPGADWIRNPDLSAVAGQPAKYWTVAGDAVLLMSQAERDAVDAAEAQAATDADRAGNKARLDGERVLKALALTILDEINVLRSKVVPALTPRTVAQMVNAIKAKVDQL